MSDKHYDISYLEGTTTALKKLKDYSFNWFTHIAEGTIAELGCGTGVDAIALARLLGNRVSVIGIDHDPQMVEKAKSLSSGSENVSFLLSDVALLPFEDSTLSGVRTERLIQHLQEPQQVVHEIYRVLKPESPLLIVETDWRSISFYNAETSIEEKVISYLTEEKVNNGHAARQLTRYLERSGLKNIKIEIFPFVLKSLQEVFMYLLVDQTLNEMKEKGYLSVQEHESFLTSLRLADQNNYFACSINIVVVSSVK